MNNETDRRIPEQGDIFGESVPTPDNISAEMDTAPERRGTVSGAEINENVGKSTRKRQKSKKDEPFEKLLSRLEDIVEAMESGGLPLEDMMKLYEEGVQKAEALTAMLADARTRVMKLVKNESGEFVLEPFEGEESR